MSGDSARLVIFDLDGTLLCSTEVDEACYVRAFELEFGLVDLDRDWSGYRNATEIGIAIEIFERHLDRPATDEEILRLEQRFVALLEEVGGTSPESFRQVPGASDLLGHLDGPLGWSIALATGTWRSAAQTKLRQAGMELRTVGAAYTDDDRVRTGIVRKAMERAVEACGVTPERVVLVGDAVWDVRVARDLGLPMVGVRADGDEARLRREGASHVVRDFTAMDDFVEALESARVPARVNGYR